MNFAFKMTNLARARAHRASDAAGSPSPGLCRAGALRRLPRGAQPRNPQWRSVCQPCARREVPVCCLARYAGADLSARERAEPRGRHDDVGGMRNAVADCGARVPQPVRSRGCGRSVACGLPNGKSRTGLA